MSLIKRICVVPFLGKEHLVSTVHQVPMVQDYLPVRHIRVKLNLESFDGSGLYGIVQGDR